MWNLHEAKYKVTYSYSRVFVGNAGSDVDVSMEVVTDVKAEQVSLGLVKVDADEAALTLDRVEKNPIVASSPNGVSLVIAARFMNVAAGEYKAVVSDGIDGAPGSKLVVP